MAKDQEPLTVRAVKSRMRELRVLQIRENTRHAKAVAAIRLKRDAIQGRCRHVNTVTVYEYETRTVQCDDCGKEL